MKKNLVIVALALALTASIVLMYYQGGEGVVSESTTVKTPVVVHLAPETSVPVAPKSDETSVSEVDQKLEELGFAPSASVHKISVQN